eukprot:g3530.t1
MLRSWEQQWWGSCVFDEVFGTWNKDTARGETRETSAPPQVSAEVVDSEDTLENAKESISSKAATPLSGIRVLTTASQALRGDPDYQNRLLRYKMDVNPRVLRELRKKKLTAEKDAKHAAYERGKAPEYQQHVPAGGFSPTDVATLRKFLWSSGKIKPKRVTGLTAKQQRQLARAVKQARQFGLIPTTYALPESLVRQVVPDAIVSAKGSTGKRRVRPELVVDAETIKTVQLRAGFKRLMAQLRQRTSTKIEVSNPKSGNLCHINISGRRENVEVAKKEFEKVVSVYGRGDESVASTTVQLPENMVGAIFGPGGNVRRQVLDDLESDLLMVTGKASGDGSVPIELFGSPDTIALTENYLGSLAGDKEFHYERVTVEKEDAGIVIGKNFKNFNRVASSSGAFLSADRDASGAVNHIDIYGSRAQVSSAMAMILRSESALTLDGSNSASSWLRGSVARGEAGQVLRKYGVSCRFSEDGQSATLVGPGKQPQLASSELEGAFLSRVRKRSIAIPQYSQDENAVLRLKKYLLERFDVALLDEDGPTATKAVGLRENIKGVSKWLRAHSDTAVRVPNDLIKYVVGKSGAGLKRLVDKTGAKTSVVDSGDSSHAVYFYGNVDEMTEAKRRVDTIVDRHVNKPGIESTAALVPGVDYDWATVHRWTGAVTDMSSSGTDVNICGASERVIDDVREYISRRSKHAEDTTRSEMLVASDAIGQILGRGGNNMKFLHYLTGASISYDNGRLSLAGPSDQVQHAERLIKSKALAISQESMATKGASVDIPVAGTGLLMGNMNGDQDRGSNLLSRISFETGTILLLSQSGMDERSKTLTAYGAPEQVAVAVDSIQELLENTDLSTEKLQLAGKMHLAGALLGESGEHIRRLQEQTQTKILIRGESIEVHGERSSVQEAVKELENTIASLDGQKAVRVRIPKDRIGEITGVGGRHLREIRSRSGATRVVISKTDADWHANHVEIQGTPQQIKAAKDQLVRKLNEIESSSYESFLKVPREHVGYLLGKGGEVVYGISDSTETTIQLLPRVEADEEHWRTFSITGPLTRTKAAKEILMSTILEREGAIVEDSLNLPENMVGTIVGKGFSNIREFEIQSGASIAIMGEAGGQGKTVDVTMKGTPAEIEIAKSMIISTVKEAEEQGKGGGKKIPQ